MSCFKIVIGFYQVIAGIFSALTRVRWPVTLISMGKYLKLMEGTIFQFAPLSCIHSRLRMDPFSIFLVTLAVNSSVISLIFLYLFLKRRYIRKIKRSNCISLLKADYSIRCFTTRHQVYWPIGATFALYPVAFPLLILVLLYKFRDSQEDKELAFGLRVFFENYTKEF